MPKILLIFLSLSLLASTVSANSETSLLDQGEQAIAAGHINQAISLLQQAKQQSSDAESRWLASIALADALIRAGRIEAAETELTKIYPEAKLNAPKAILGEIALRLGHVQVAHGNPAQAQIRYREALNNAELDHDHALAASALLNLAKLTPASDTLQQAQRQLTEVPEGDIKEQLLLALGFQAGQQQQFELAYQSLQAVLQHSTNARHKAEALGLLGSLYERQQRFAEALQLTEQALVTDTSPDQHLQWTWQHARLLERQAKKPEALAEYRSAVQQLQRLRADIPVLYQDGESSFKKTFAPIYLNFIALLLQDTAPSQSILDEAIQTWEQLKAVELQDYFKDACAVKQKALTTSLEANTAILYPILFDDHLALILRTPKGLSSYRVKHSAREIDTAVKQLNDEITNVGELTQHHPLYDWLIRPVRAALEAQQIDTLVYIPDGPLRKIPIALLHDGTSFLVEHYALVTVPGLSMLAAPSIDHSRDDIVLAGMSQPGPVVEELIASGINLFGSETKENRGLQRRALPKLRSAEFSAVDPTERNLRVSRLKEELALPGVTEELKSLSALSSLPVLENADFLLHPFKDTVHQGHTSVHIASHGFFSGDPNKSFIMAYDHLITMDELSKIFQTEAFHDRPIELVTLSACQTAEGDDRSPLGLSGVVVQTGVKSAIGTLWPVADEAAKQLFSDFYLRYQQPNMTKAKAMQYAQKHLMQNNALNHPAYWGPFVLVGEWH